MRPGREGQRQGHADPVHQLPGVQVHGGAQRRQFLMPRQQYVGGAAGQVQRDKRVALQSAAVPGCGHMPPLVGGGIERHPQRGSQGLALLQAHLENRHIGCVPVPGRGGGADTGDGLAGCLQKRQQHVIQLPYMRKHGLALAKAAFSCRNRQ